MKAMIPILLIIMMVSGHVALAQSPPFYVPYQAPPTPQYAPATAPPVQVPQVQPRQQPFRMYDQSYKGPYNMYGQPAITGVRRQQRAQQTQPQSINNGVFQRAFRGVGGLGGYLWSYMPAPLTGAKNPYEVPTGQGQYSVNFVPSR